MISLEREENPNKTDSIRHLGEVDIAALQEAVDKLQESDWDLWDQQKPNPYPSLRQVKHIVFKFSAKRSKPLKYHTYPVWEDWKDLIEPILEAATKPYGYASAFFPRVMLAKLPPGGKISPHMDGPHDESRPHKIHIPIQTNPMAKFILVPDVYHFEVGQAYEVNNGLRHAVANNGDTDRIHLIFEYLQLPE